MFCQTQTNHYFKTVLDEQLLNVFILIPQHFKKLSGYKHEAVTIHWE